MSLGNDSEQYFIRRRGRVSGPFDHFVIEKMVKNSKLYKSDEISVDQDEWVTAGETEFFPKTQKRSRNADTSVSDRSKVASTDEESEDASQGYGLINTQQHVISGQRNTSIPPRNKEWFYAIGDQSLGPVNESEIKLQIMLKNISPDTKVWSEGMADWIEVKSYPPFASILKNSKSSNTQESTQEPNRSQPRDILQGKYCVSCGNIIASEAVLCPKCGSSQGNHKSKLKSSTIKLSYLITFFFPIAGIIYFIYFLIKEEIGHAIGNLVLAIFAFSFWPAFLIAFLGQLSV